MNNKKLSEMTLDELWHLFPIELKVHDDKWSEYYQEMKCRLLNLIEVDDTKIHHIGSTAIKGIWTKPIIDILIEFADTKKMNEAADILANNGFNVAYKEEKRIHLNLGYTPNGFDKKVYHLHLRLANDIDEIYFKDYLNEHSDVAKEYEKLKLDLWKKFEFNRDGYTQAKTQFIKKYTNMAKEYKVFNSLETKRLYLKNIDSSDREFILKQFSDVDVNEYLYDAEAMKDISEADELIEFYTQEEPCNQHRWIIINKENNEKIGTCGFHCLDKKHKCVDIGYDLQKSYWNQGIMYEALKAVLDIYIPKLAIDRIYAHIYVDNLRSINLIKKLGFEFKGDTEILEFHNQNYLHNIYVLERNK